MTSTTVITSCLTSLSCTSCGDTVSTYQPISPHSTVWCGRQFCFFELLAWQPTAQWRTYATAGGFQVWRQMFEAAAPIVTMTEPELALSRAAGQGDETSGDQRGTEAARARA